MSVEKNKDSEIPKLKELHILENRKDLEEVTSDSLEE